MAAEKHHEKKRPSQKTLTLPIISPLILQPLLVLLDTPNLLPVVVWDGITEALEGGVDAVLFDMLEEFTLSLINLPHNPPLDHGKRTTPQNRSSKPPQSSTANGSKPEEDYRVHAHYHLRRVDLFIGEVADAGGCAEGAGEE